MKSVALFLLLIFVLGMEASTSLAQESNIHDGKLIGHASAGKQLYRRYCIGCHGPEGDGRGENAAWIDPKPRDFTAGVFKCRSTPTGLLPTDDDVFEAISRGFVDTNMPAWGPLTNQNRADLVAYIKTFSPRWKEDKPATPISIPPEPKVTPESVLRGRQLYQKMECWKCHGLQGHGDGPSAATLTDSRDNPLRPYNFSVGSRFKCGQSNQDLYRIFMTGLDGTPMPSFADDIKPEDAWNLVHFLRTLQPMRTLETRVWKDWTAAHPQEARALRPIGPASVAQADDEASTVSQSTQIPSPASNRSSGPSGAAPIGDAFAEKSKAESASMQATPQSSNTAAPETGAINGTRPPLAARAEEDKALKATGSASVAQADDEARTASQPTRKIPSPASNVSSGSSGAAPAGDAFSEKSNVARASTQAAPQSSNTAPPEAAKTSAIKPHEPQAPKVQVPLSKQPLSGPALFLQVGAFAHETNARKLAESLRQENFPASVITSTSGAFYLVHVGPYADEKSAQNALGELVKAGFKPFIRHHNIAQARK